MLRIFTKFNANESASSKTLHHNLNIDISKHHANKTIYRLQIYLIQSPLSFFSSLSIWWPRLWAEALYAAQTITLVIIWQTCEITRETSRIYLILRDVITPRARASSLVFTGPFSLPSPRERLPVQPWTCPVGVWWKWRCKAWNWSGIHSSWLRKWCGRRRWFCFELEYWKIFPVRWGTRLSYHGFLLMGSSN